MSHGFARRPRSHPTVGCWWGVGAPLGLVGAHHTDISEQKIVGLHAVLPGNNWVAFTLSGAYGRLG